MKINNAMRSNNRNIWSRRLAVQAIYSWSYAQKGAYFIGFALPSSTLVYDTITQRWHERKSTISGVVGAYRVNAMVQAYNQVFCGDIEDGKIGKLDPDVYTEYGNTIQRRLVTQPFQNNMQSFYVPYLELTTESGVGLQNEPEPLIGMERSQDGMSWSHMRYRTLGKIGERNARAIWRRNGRASRYEMYRFTLTDPVKPILIQLTANIIGGTQ